VVGEPERLVGDDLLGFAGIGPAVALAIPAAQQFAEKVHAYSFPWAGRTNTRTKDLVDLVLLIERGPPGAAEIRKALRATFTTRGTHPLPEVPGPPPEQWAADFATMAGEAEISTADHLAAYAKLKQFWTDHALGEGGDE
jgi:hypothetical protein